MAAEAQVRSGVLLERPRLDPRACNSRIRVGMPVVLLFVIAASFVYGWTVLVPLGTAPCCESWWLMQIMLRVNKVVGQAAGVSAILLSIWIGLADPGWVRREDAAKADAEAWGRCSVPQCGVLRPLGSHHCSECGQCCAGFDHHCGWLGVCIGQRTRLPFILLLGCGGVAWTLLGAASVQAAYVTFDRQVAGWWVVRHGIEAYFFSQAGSFLLGFCLLQSYLLRTGRAWHAWFARNESPRQARVVPKGRSAAAGCSPESASDEESPPDQALLRRSTARRDREL